MSKNKFEYKLWREDNVVNFQVIEQTLRGKEAEFTAANGVSIISTDFPTIAVGILWIRGIQVDYDDDIDFITACSPENAIELLEQSKTALEEYKAHIESLGCELWSEERHEQLSLNNKTESIEDARERAHDDVRHCVRTGEKLTPEIVNRFDFFVDLTNRRNKKFGLGGGE